MNTALVARNSIVSCQAIRSVGALMSPKSADYLTGIRQRAADYLPDILDLLKARGHPRRDEVESAVVDAADAYFHLSQPQSRKRKEAMKKIATDARRLRAALAPKTLTDDQRDELQEIVDTHLRSYPANTFGRIFANPSSVQRLIVQLDQLIRAFRRVERLVPAAAKTRLSENCLIVFETFRPGEATSGLKGDFLTFVGLVYEVATGEPPSRDASMSTPIRTMLRKYRTLLAEGKEGEELWRSL